LPDQCSKDHFDSKKLTDCHEWIYDTSVYYATFMAEENLVCDEEWKVPLSQSVFFFGVLVMMF
jgi:hypothetical protein